MDFIAKPFVLFSKQKETQHGDDKTQENRDFT